MRLPRGARREQVTTSSGVTLSVVVAGDGLPLLLLHGFTGAGAAWGDIPLRLARHHTVVVPDLPGHGASDPVQDPASYTWSTLVDNLIDVMAEVAPGPAVWAGYSMGGRLALCAAASGRVEPAALILESTSPGLEHEGEREERIEADERWATLLDAGDMKAFVEAWTAQPIFASQDRLPRLILESENRRRTQGDPGALAACLRGFGTGRQPSWWSNLSEISCPVLFLTGALDEKFDALGDRMAEAVPLAHRARVRGAGHAVHLEKPEAWLSDVTPFLETVRERHPTE